MILTGKASKDFIKWLHFKHNLQPYNLFNEIIQYALIIEWFDSVGIYINSSGLTLSKTFISDVSVNNNCEYNYDGFRTRKEAIEQAIKKANEIYNETTGK